MNNFGGIILGFRSAEQVATGDISKMFNAIKVREQDQHLRRFFCRPDGIGGKEDFKIAVITKVNFGERAAGTVATSVKDRCAEENAEISPPVAKMIKEKSFMDDIQINAKYRESLQENIDMAEQIMAKGNFSFKSWTKSGDKGVKKMWNDQTEAIKSLGISWKTEADELVYRIRLNFSKKKRNKFG